MPDECAPVGAAFVVGMPSAVVAVLRAAADLTRVLPAVVAVALVGSRARRAARPDSDVDLVVLTNDVGAALSSSDWFTAFGDDAALIRSADFGAIQERRLRLPDATVIEVGLGTPDWARVDPVDDGTRRVVSDGWMILHDPLQLLARLTDHVTRRPA